MLTARDAVEDRVLGLNAGADDYLSPARNGYLLTVVCPCTGVCPCGVVFERWVTPEDAELDLLRAAGLN
jgi:hypothetical protein